MTARAFMEQVRTVILQRRVRETQSRSEPAGAFQSLIAHNIVREQDIRDYRGQEHLVTSLRRPSISVLCASSLSSRSVLCVTRFYNVPARTAEVNRV
jgi:hypothetical protein